MCRFSYFSLFLSLLALSASGCFQRGEVEINDLDNLRASIARVEVLEENRFKVSGSRLDSTQEVHLKGDGLDEQMVIEESSENTLVVRFNSVVELATSSVFELILSNAQGSTTHPISFALEDGQVTTVKLADEAVTGEKIASMGAEVGQILRFDGTSWTVGDLDALTFAGLWDASTGDQPYAYPARGRILYCRCGGKWL